MIPPLAQVQSHKSQFQISRIIIGFALILIFINIFSLNADATITIDSIGPGTASGVILGTTTPVAGSTTPTVNEPVIFGGIAGSDSAGDCASKNNTQTCNNCVAGAPGSNARFQPCNTKRIYPTLNLLITFKSDKVVSGLALAKTELTASAATIAQGSVVTKDTLTTLSIPWDQICTNIGSSGCTANAEKIIFVGVGANNATSLEGSDSDSIKVKIVLKVIPAGISIATQCTDSTGGGICYFEIGSGDEKAVVKKLRGFTGTNELNYTAVRFYYSPDGFTALNPSSPFVDLNLTGSEGDLTASPSRIDGLTNDLTYYFKSAIVDAAGNVGYFTPDALDETTAACNEVPADVTHPTHCHIAYPSEVAGVLSENKCFIATAAYGSPLAPQIDVFRKFRDHHLLTHSWGIRLVGFYYKHSPKLAKIIANSETLRYISRMVLWPILALVSVFLNYGTLVTLAVLTALGALPFILISAWSRIPKTARGSRE